MAYRCYAFGNFYLSSIQQGIQAAHAVAELSLKYLQKPKNHKGRRIVEEWIKEDKVMILLNGGNHRDLEELTEMLDSYQPAVPWAYFTESKDDLNSAMTSVVVIVDDDTIEDPAASADPLVLHIANANLAR